MTRASDDQHFFGSCTLQSTHPNTNLILIFFLVYIYYTLIFLIHANNKVTVRID